MSKQNPIRPHAARKIRDFSDRLLASGRPVNRQIGGDDATYLTELETMFEGLRKAGVPKH